MISRRSLIYSAAASALALPRLDDAGMRRVKQLGVDTVVMVVRAFHEEIEKVRTSIRAAGRGRPQSQRSADWRIGASLNTTIPLNQETNRRQRRSNQRSWSLG